MAAPDPGPARPVCARIEVADTWATIALDSWAPPAAEIIKRAGATWSRRGQRWTLQGGDTAALALSLTRAGVVVTMLRAEEVADALAALAARIRAVPGPQEFAARLFEGTSAEARPPGYGPGDAVGPAGR